MKKIVIVDDSKLFRISFKKFLETAGYEIIEAIDGRAGLELFQEQNVEADLLITDLYMPQMDGVTMAKHIRNIDIYKKLPIFILTVEGHQISKQQVRELNIEAWITKPFNKEKILWSIEKMFKHISVRTS